MKGPSKRRLGIVALCVAAVLVLALTATVAGCGSASTTTTAGPTTTVGSGGGATQVALQNLQISPTSVTVKAGDTVTWTNKDGFTHRLVGDNGEFDSGDLVAGATFSFVFKTAGTVAYHCSIHPSMTGTIVVQ